MSRHVGARIGLGQPDLSRRDETGADHGGARRRAVRDRTRRSRARRAPEHDTIFFLADGQPTTGITTDPEEILRDVRLANPDARLRIHTILLPTEGAIASRFMTSLATENGGQSITLGAQ